MSPPPVPSPFAAIGTLVRLQVVRLVRGRRVRLGAIAVALVLLAIGAARYGSDADPTDVMEKAVDYGYFRLLVFLLPFLLSSGAIAEEVESRTFSYLASRPVGRLALTVGKYAAGAGLAVALLVGGLLLTHITVYLTEPSLMVEELPSTLQSAAGVGILAIFYAALCTFWGALAPEAAGIVSALYLAIIEFAFGFTPVPIRYISMNYLASQLAGMPVHGFGSATAPELAAWVPITAIVPFTAIVLMLAVLVVSTSEYRHGKA